MNRADIPDCLACGDTLYVLAGARFVCANEDCDRLDEPVTLDQYEDELQNIAERRAERAFESYHSGGSGWDYEQEARQQWIRDHLKR